MGENDKRVIKRRTTEESEHWRRKRRRERKKEYNNIDSDVGYEEDNCVGERSDQPALVFKNERERAERQEWIQSLKFGS